MRRLYISIIAAVLGAIFAIGWGLDFLVDQRDNTDEEGGIAVYQRIIQGAAKQLANADEQLLAPQAQQLAHNFSVSFRLEHKDNVALPPSLNTQLSQSGSLLLASQQGSYLLQRIDNHPLYLLQLDLPSQADNNQQFDLLLTIALYLGVSVIIILWSLPLTRRLYLLNQSAAKFGAGEFSVRLPKSKFSYIPMLEHSFNRMASQIETLMADNKLLARSLSHDIRTPIACLRFGIEAALDTSDAVKKNQYIQRMDSEITRMEQMTAAFLEYAGLERQAGSLSLSTVELNQWLARACDDFGQLAASQNIEVEFVPSSADISTEIDIQWFHRALQNLLSNAIDFAQTKVVVTLRLQSHKVIEISVADDGPGIATDDLVSIFEPYVRSGEKRSRELGHFGLGLAITSKIMDWHGGTAVATHSESLGGACFILYLGPNQKNTS